MTELELLKMLSCVQSSYIQQADAFREGRLRIVRKKRPVVTALKILSVAAMFVLILGAGYFGLQNLAAKEASEKASETMAAQSGAMADAEDWQRMVLRDGIRFYNGDFANSYNSYTVSEFCGVLAKWMGTEEAPKPARYAALDMDGDGLEELVVELEGTGDLPRLVLGSFDGQIKGEIYYERQMSHLKADGVFYASGGIGKRSWARLQRSADGWTVEDLEGDYTDEPDAVWTQWVSLGTAEVTDSAATLPMRENNGSLIVWQEGVGSTVPASLFIGQGFSMYMPEEHWVYESVDYHGVAADRWIYADENLEEFVQNTTLQFTSWEAMQVFYDRKYPIRMTVFYHAGMDDDTLRDWVRQANPEVSFEQNAKGNLYADEMCVFFLRAGNGAFVCVEEYPLEATEGAGATMAAMWESFERWPDEYFPYIQTFEKRSAQTTFNLARYIDSEQRWEDYAADFQLYRVYGYSTYVPQEGFSREETTYGGLPAEKWVCRENPDVWFMVVNLQTDSHEDAVQWALSAGGSDYTLIEDKRGGMSGGNADNTAFLSIGFQQREINNDIYGVISYYPLAENDNLGVYVKVMADEFRTE